MTRDFEYRFREPLVAPEALGAQPPAYQRTVDNGVIIERDIAVTMRDGVRIYIDLYRPADERPAPPLIAWAPYGKHGTWQLMPSLYHVSFPTADVPVDRLSPYTVFEAPDPMYWAPRGYAIITVNPRGMWFSEGTATFVSPEEAQDEYDLIEWAGTQPWSNGKVGLIGVSYLALSQYSVAAMHPPHLAAINPWEGWSDLYREVVRHGGIPETEFWGRLPWRWGASKTSIEDVRRETQEHPLFDSFWASKNADLSRITVPAYVVASWTDQGLHTRGTLKAFEKISSRQKWLEVHGRKKWAYFYEPESVERQQAFFDRFLKEIPNQVDAWPQVRVEVRERYNVGPVKTSTAWPIPSTQYARLYLDGRDGSLSREPVAAPSACRYESRPAAGACARARFDFKFERRTDLVGYMKLKLWMTAAADDMDIFVALQKLDAAGNVVGFAYFMQFDDGPVALGWLRASHRELDCGQSTEFQPVLLHQRELKLTAGEVVPLDIEVWPSGTRFAAGESLRLVIQGSDIPLHPGAFAQHVHADSVNSGDHVIHTGGPYGSYLLVPVVDLE